MLSDVAGFHIHNSGHLEVYGSQREDIRCETFTLSVGLQMEGFQKNRNSIGASLRHYTASSVRPTMA